MKFIEQVDLEEFSSFVENHPTKSHFLASPLWGELSKSRGYTPFYVGVKENETLIATALLLKKSLPFGYCYFYIPRGFVMDYQNLECLSFFTTSLKKFVKKQKGLYFKIDPDIRLHTISEDATCIEGENHYQLVSFLKKIGYKHLPLTKYFETSQPRYTFRIDLKNEIEDIRKRYSKTALRFIKKAEHFEVEPSIGTKEDIPQFIRLMKLTEQRQNFFSHPDDYYEKFYDIFSASNHVSLLLAKVSLSKMIAILKEDIQKEKSAKEINLISLEKKQKELSFLEEEKKKRKEDKIVVSSYFTVHYGDKSWYLYGANDMDYKMTYANYRLFDYQIEISKEKGSSVFDEFGTIGEPKSDHPLVGLHEFKKKFGGEYLEFIGEFDYIIRPIFTFFFLKLVRIYRFAIRKKLRKKVQKEKI